MENVGCGLPLKKDIMPVFQSACDKGSLKKIGIKNTSQKLTCSCSGICAAQRIVIAMTPPIAVEIALDPKLAQGMLQSDSDSSHKAHSSRRVNSSTGS